VISSAVHFTAADVPLGVISRQVAAWFASDPVAFSLVATAGDRNAGWLARRWHTRSQDRQGRHGCGKIEGLGRQPR